ncbi:MAG: hypothetical protein WB755_05815 [Terriglobales bacterium]
MFTTPVSDSFFGHLSEALSVRVIRLRRNYEIRFAVLKPSHLTGCFMTGHLYCTPRAMWKLSWFLRDFGYDAELLGKNEIDDKALIDLWGVVKVNEVTVHGISVLNFDGFAPAARWEELSVFTDSDPRGTEVSS